VRGLAVNEIPEAFNVIAACGLTVLRSAKAGAAQLALFILSSTG